MLKLAGEFIEGQLADHKADLDAHTRDIAEIVRTGEHYLYPLGEDSLETIEANVLYSRPLIVARNITFDRIAIDVSSAGAAGTKARLGIYENGTNCHPGALILDAGEVAVDSTGIKTIVINLALSKGLYWLVIVSDGTPQVHRDSYQDLFSPLGLNAGNFATTNTNWRVAFTYATLPDPHPASGLNYWGAIRLPLRVASLD